MHIIEKLSDISCIFDQIYINYMVTETQERFR
jgi:hypothetical protein